LIAGQINNSNIAGVLSCGPPSHAVYYTKILNV